MISRIYKVVTCTVLIAITLMVLLHISSRFIGSPIYGAEEIERYLFISMVFLSLALITRSDAHIRFDSVITKFPAGIKNIVQRIINGTCTLFFGLAFYSAINTMMRNFWNKTASISMPFVVFAMPAAVGFLLVTIEYFLKTVGPSSPGKDQLKNAEGEV